MKNSNHVSTKTTLISLAGIIAVITFAACGGEDLTPAQQKLADGRAVAAAAAAQVEQRESKAERDCWGMVEDSARYGIEWYGAHSSTVTSACDNDGICRVNNKGLKIMNAYGTLEKSHALCTIDTNTNTPLLVVINGQIVLDNTGV